MPLGYGDVIPDTKNGFPIYYRREFLPPRMLWHFTLFSNVKPIEVCVNDRWFVFAPSENTTVHNANPNYLDVLNPETMERALNSAFEIQGYFGSGGAAPLFDVLSPMSPWDTYVIRSTAMEQGLISAPAYAFQGVEISGNDPDNVLPPVLTLGPTAMSIVNNNDYTNESYQSTGLSLWDVMRNGGNNAESSFDDDSVVHKYRRTGL